MKYTEHSDPGDETTMTDTVDERKILRGTIGMMLRKHGYSEIVIKELEDALSKCVPHPDCERCNG